MNEESENEESVVDGGVLGRGAELVRKDVVSRQGEYVCGVCGRVLKGLGRYERHVVKGGCGGVVKERRVPKWHPRLPEDCVYTDEVCAFCGMEWLGMTRHSREGARRWLSYYNHVRFCESNPDVIENKRRAIKVVKYGLGRMSKRDRRKRGRKVAESRRRNERVRLGLEGDEVVKEDIGGVGLEFIDGGE